MWLHTFYPQYNPSSPHQIYLDLEGKNNCTKSPINNSLLLWLVKQWSQPATRDQLAVCTLVWIEKKMQQEEREAIKLHLLPAGQVTQLLHHRRATKACKARRSETLHLETTMWWLLDNSAESLIIVTEQIISHTESGSRAPISSQAASGNRIPINHRAGSKQQC